MTETIQFIKQKFNTPVLKKWGDKDANMAKLMTIFILKDVLHYKPDEIKATIKCSRQRIYSASSTAKEMIVSNNRFRAILLKLLLELDTAYPEKAFGDYVLPKSKNHILNQYAYHTRSHRDD